MHKHFVITGSIICFLCCFILLASCGNTKDGPKASKVVTQKISETKSTVPPGQSGAVSSKTAEVTPKAESGTLTGTPDKTDQSLIASISDTDQRMCLFNTGHAYNPEGKVDPFLPIFRDEPAAPVAKPNKKDQKIKRIPSTPLEKLDLSQLKLVGIIQSKKGNKGLVEEASGKGYIISKGTYIGNRSGRVVEILEDKVIIEEESENAFDGATVCKKELKLQKPTGEE
jgi:type IV pilus assembly protein PilP